MIAALELAALAGLAVLAARRSAGSGPRHGRASHGPSLLEVLHEPHRPQGRHRAVAASRRALFENNIADHAAGIDYETPEYRRLYRDLWAVEHGVPGGGGG